MRNWRQCLIMTYGRDFEPMAEIFFWCLHDFGISGYVHVLAHCALLGSLTWISGIWHETPQIKILSVALLSQAKQYECGMAPLSPWIAGFNVLNKRNARTTARNQSVKSIRSLANLLQKKTGYTEHTTRTNTHFFVSAGQKWRLIVFGTPCTIRQFWPFSCSIFKML